MSKMLTTRFQRLIEKEIRKAPVKLNYHFENGPKHRKLYIEGKMVLVFSHGPQEHADTARIRAFIRRAVEEKQC